MLLISKSMFLPTSRLLVLSVVIISLSGQVESRECYWCGPMAEQVHRSQRAPSCSGPLETTACDSGLTHCAIVATSPPYAESRYCVKLYQDECYSLFCNSAKTWRMICPCRGDRCNGVLTDRENEAFTILNKLVIKSRNKRTVTAPNNVSIDNDTDTNNNITFNESGQTVDSVLDEIQIENLTAENINTEIEPENYSMIGNDNAVNTSGGNTRAQNIINNEDIIVNEELKMDIPTTKQLDMYITSTATINIKPNQNDSPATSETMTKPKEQLPTAEALQHVSPQMKQSEAITVTTVKTTINHETTLKPTTPTKNFGVTIHVQITIIRIVAIISLLL